MKQSTWTVKGKLKTGDYLDYVPRVNSQFLSLLTFLNYFGSISSISSNSKKNSV